MEIMRSKEAGKEAGVKEIDPAEERAASLVEYVLLVSLIAVVVVLSLRFLGMSVSTKFSVTASSLNT